MSNTLVQVVAGGAGSGTLTTAGTNISCTGNYGISTQAGSLLIAVVYSKGTISSGPFNCALSAATSGITWTQSQASWGSSNPQGIVAICYSQNSSAVLSSTANTFTMTHTASISNIAALIECTLYEVSGALLSGSIVQVTQSQQFKSGGTVTTGTPSPIANDFLIAAYGGDSGGLTNGAAFILGPNPGTVGGGSQYIVNTAGGSQSAAFVGGPLTNWSAVTIGFRTQPVTGGASYGFFFG